VASAVLSVIVPVLNEAANLERLLPHLRAVCPGAEVIVVDGGSQDDTRSVVSRFPWVTWHFSARGRARQMNVGAALATGDTLLFLHADTLPPEGAPPAVRQALRREGVVGGRFDVQFDSPRAIFRLIAGLMNTRSRVTRICTGDQGIFVRRDAFRALGGYPEMPLMEDVEFTRRLKSLGRLACLRLRVTTSARKWERDGVLRTILLMWTLRFLFMVGVSPERLHRWYYPRPPVGAEEPGGAGLADVPTRAPGG
jgi:rSAM/selenodomain-associated transferase 2